MPEVTQQQIAESETSAPSSEPVETQEPASEAPPAADTAETVAETDEQKNARELAESRERSEKRAKGVQKRMDELTAEKYAERQRAERLERLLEQAIGQKPAAAQPAAEQEPKREQFSDYEDFVAAKAEYRAMKKAEGLIEQRLRGAQQVEQQRFVEQEAGRLRQTFLAKQQEFAKTVPDYDDVVRTEDVRVPPETAALLHTMDDAPAVIYHMAKNPEVVQQLWNRPGMEQAVILGKLSAAVKGTPQVSTAPAPGKPTGARSGETNTPPADMEGYLRWRAKQRGQK